MSTTEDFVQSYEFGRGRTLALLDAIEKEPDPQDALVWQPGPGRAHMGWQLMHIAITEEIFASERLAPHRVGQWQDLWPRFRGGRTPDDNVPTTAEIREKLAHARRHLLETLAEYSDDRLDEIPPAFRERGWNVRHVLHLIGWHEAHHQGQAHLTLNLYRARQAA